MLQSAVDIELLVNPTVYLHFASTLSHLPTLCNNDICGRSLASKPCVFDFSHYIHPIDNLTEDDVFVVQEWGRNGRNEELRTVGVGPGVLYG